MNVDSLYSRNVVRAPASCTLWYAAALMRDRHVGALLVTGEAPHEDEVMGVITDRDLVVRAMAEDVRPGEATVAQFMTRALVMVPKSASVYEAMEIMRSSGVRRLGVTDANGEVVGVVSLDDIAEPLAAELASFAGVVRTERIRETLRSGEPLQPGA
jgi:CBS domain-containing protein